MTTPFLGVLGEPRTNPGRTQDVRGATEPRTEPRTRGVFPPVGGNPLCPGFGSGVACGTWNPGRWFPFCPGFGDALSGKGGHPQ
jgi:hypothetical protein